jgi:tetratricopeptide (TPR) repeat protein
MLAARLRVVVASLALGLLACSTVPLLPAEIVADLPEGGALAADSPAARERHTRARQSLQRGAYAEAADIAGESVDREPRDATARLLLGRALTELARAQPRPETAMLEAAEVELLSAIRLQPRHVEAHVALGTLYELEGHLEAALRAYRRALDFSAFDREALLAASRLSVETGEERAAALHLEALRTLPDFPVEALVWEGRCYHRLAAALDQRKFAKTLLGRARRAWIELQERQPQDARGYLGEAHCLWLAMDESPATATPADKQRLRQLCERAAALAPGDPLAPFDLGVYLESEVMADGAGAQAAYREALARDPRHLPSMLNLARLLWLAERKDEAKELWRRALPLVDDTREKTRIETLLAGASP